jgi:hypothetical protein
MHEQLWVSTSCRTVIYGLKREWVGGWGCKSDCNLVESTCKIWLSPHAKSGRVHMQNLVRVHMQNLVEWTCKIWSSRHAKSGRVDMQNLVESTCKCAKYATDCPVGNAEVDWRRPARRSQQDFQQLCSGHHTPLSQVVSMCRSAHTLPQNVSIFRSAHIYSTIC